jgi:hypothetical protein
MPGFDQSTRRRVYELSFERYGGLIVRTRKPSFRGLEMLADAVDVLGEQLISTARPLDERVWATGRLVRAFADSLMGWGLFDEGRAVPATLDAVLSQDDAFLIDVARMWYRRVVMLIDTEQPQALAVAPEQGEDDELPTLEEELAALKTFRRSPRDEPVGATGG